jgi:hypothetical protein
VAGYWRLATSYWRLAVRGKNKMLANKVKYLGSFKIKKVKKM